MKNLLLHYKSHWELQQVEILTKTPRAYVYRAQHKGTAVVLKIFRGKGIAEERRGTEFLQICKGYGVVDLIQSDSDAILIDYCDGKSLEDHVIDGKDQEAAIIIADLLNRLHTCPIPDNHSLISLAERFSPLFNHYENHHLIETEDISLFAKAAHLARSLLQNQQDVSLLHGDIHHGNIIFDSLMGWRAIDPKGIIGDRAYDVANVMMNPWDYPSLVQDKKRVMAQAGILAARMEVDGSKVIQYAFVHACLSALWFIEEGERSIHAHAMMKIMAPLVD